MTHWCQLKLEMVSLLAFKPAQKWIMAYATLRYQG